MGLVAGAIALLVVFMSITPTGMVPNEDTGTIMGSVTLPRALRRNVLRKC